MDRGSHAPFNASPKKYFCGAWLAIPGASEAGRRQADYGEVGRLQKQSQGAILHADGKGREQLVAKAEQWKRLTRAMGLILGTGFDVQGEEA